MKNIVVIGATSAIAKEVCRAYAKKSHNIHLVGRSLSKLSSLHLDLSNTSAGRITSSQFDFDSSRDFVAAEHMGNFETVDTLLIAMGHLGVEDDCDHKIIINRNYTNVVSAINTFLPHFMKQSRGTIAAITSVAGDRGRGSNYLYGSSKAALSTYLEGLRHKLSSSGIAVVDLKLGQVDTPMTASFDKGPLWTTPAKIANLIVNKIETQKAVAYIPGYWKYIMLVIKYMPRKIFNRLQI